MKLTARQAQHLALRAGFGARYDQIEGLIGQPPQKAYRSLRQASDSNTPLAALQENDVPLGEKVVMMSQSERVALAAEQRDKKRDLNTEWLASMAEGPQVRERLALFWHGHLACRIGNTLFMQEYANLIREHALSDYRTLLETVSKSGAMSRFLNNQQNRKNAPNENFAREVMELFTLGTGHYTEQDIKEAARAFTGWKYTRKQGGVFFAKWMQDTGQKTIFGQTGDFRGEDVVRLLLEKRRTAQFLTEKFYAHFVRRDLRDIDRQRIEALADDFYESGYQIDRLAENVFAADWFYGQDVIGQQIKAPLEYLVQLRRMFGVAFDSDDTWLLLQRRLGQTLLQPPNVAGWPGGRKWIDSAALLQRMTVAKFIFLSHELQAGDEDPADTFDAAAGIKQIRRMKAEVDWAAFAAPFKRVKDRDLPETLASYLLQVDVDDSLLLHGLDRADDRTELLKRICFNITRLPEFQLA